MLAPRIHRLCLRFFTAMSIESIIDDQGARGLLLLADLEQLVDRILDSR